MPKNKMRQLVNGSSAKRLLAKINCITATSFPAKRQLPSPKHSQTIFYYYNLQYFRHYFTDAKQSRAILLDSIANWLRSRVKLSIVLIGLVLLHVKGKLEI